MLSTETRMGTRIIAIGNALLDLFCFVEPEVPEAFGFRTGATTHVREADRLEPLLASLEPERRTAGGGAANTARAACLLGLDATFVGCVGRDLRGDFYRESLASVGVEARLSVCDKPTGLFCAMMHPDGRKTIVVAPGAAPFVTERLPELGGDSGGILYFDGFVIGDGELLARESHRARERGMIVAVDLGSRRHVEANRGAWLEILPDACDLIFANEDEFVALADSSVPEACSRLADRHCAFVVKMGDRGALYSKNGNIVESPVRAQIPIDETGAGDAFAAGFLTGLSSGFSPERCLRLGNRMAEEAIAVLGLGIDPVRIPLVRMSAGYY